jgi:hypothetical protein
MAHVEDVVAAAVLSPGEQAVAAEAWHELVALDDNARRQHIRWVHARTEDAEDKQPESFSRAQFFEHLCRCYEEAYPEPANKHGSICLFGLVAKESHAASTQDGMRYEHHHAPTYCSKRHMWKSVADISYKKYRVKLHAACHSGYASMYNYVKNPSSKKPLSELDAEVWLSADHPRGKVLQRLLEVGEQHTRGFGGRKRKAPSSSAAAIGGGGDAVSPAVVHEPVRFRRGDVFRLVAKDGVRSVLEVQAMAAQRAMDGDESLAEFCTSCGEETVAEMVRSAVAILEAPKMLALKASSRMDLLRRAGAESQCVCQGAWASGARALLCHHGEDISRFCQDVCRALDMGACRGVNMAIVGEPGSGKSMIFEPLASIFIAMGKPESKSTFPLAGTLDAHILLWHEYKHKDSMILFEDLLALTVGEGLEIRVPHRKNVPHVNNAPLFYTSNSRLRVVRDDPDEMLRLNNAMDERFCMRLWRKPIPMESRVLNFPKCGRCCAQFLLMNR